jgi:cellulose synthase/poly-beta-1,6-N-acetylglucosamine synthase-like glycosyltransferase
MSGRLDALVRVGTAGALLGTIHAAYNLRRLRRPPVDPAPVLEPVSVLLPVRDEAPRVRACLRGLSSQRHVEDLEILVLDDQSTDATLDVARKIAEDDPRIRIWTGQPLPQGWLGKPHACHQLAAAAHGRVLVFVDADVQLHPDAVAVTVTLLRTAGLDLICPYPRQLADGAGPRLLQPLLQWSWLTFLPLGVAERSARPSLSAANGQLLAVDAQAYARCGGHAAVRQDVLEDVGLLRALKRVGGRGVVVDGTTIATCRMYDDWSAARDGYTKSLWAAFGSPAGAAAVVGLLALCYIIPPLAALRGSRTGAVGYTAAVLGRILVAWRVGGRSWPDSLAHPASIAVFGWLTARSWQRRKSHRLTWKGRTL